jgi:hypothetical protein
LREIARRDIISLKYAFDDERSLFRFSRSPYPNFLRVDVSLLSPSSANERSDDATGCSVDDVVVCVVVDDDDRDVGGEEGDEDFVGGRGERHGDAVEEDDVSRSSGRPLSSFFFFTIVCGDVVLF